MTIDGPVLLDDRYRLDERIGTGGSADVWRATDQLLNREVAVKLMRQAGDPTQRDRFVDEARTLARLNHPGLIVLLDAGILGDSPYLVMTLADDATLASRIAAGPLESAVVKSIGIQVANALAYAHGCGIVHRDVKPSNVLLCEDGRALLADFGIARLVGSTQHHTRTGDAIGSPAYLAPEQVTGEDLTPAVDVYALGLVLLEALTAERAFTGTQIEAAVARLNAAPAMPASLDPGWRALLARMTHRIPQNRPTAEEVAGELALDEFVVSARDRRDPLPVTDPEPTVAAPLLDATSQLAVTMEADLGSAEVAEDVADAPWEPVGHRRRRPTVALGLGVLLVAAVLVVLAVPHSGHRRTTTVPGVPANVPARYQPSLTTLHDAVNGPAR